MAVTKTILKNVRQQAVVKFIGNGYANVDLRADLTQAEETFQGFDKTNVTIKTVMWSTDGATSAPILVQRGVSAASATNVMILYGGASDWELDQGAGFVDNVGANSNVTVILPPQGGMVYLVLGKTSGYLGPDYNALSPN
jgi:ketopantoate reductase